MTGQEAIRRLCKLTSEVGDAVFGSQRASDCFCDEAVFESPVVEEEVIEFIEAATRRSINKED